MPALTIIIVLALVLAALMWVLADRIESGQTQPNMGHHTKDSTTPESWAEACGAVAEAFRWATKHYVFAAAASIAIAAWTGSGERGATAGAMVFTLSAAVMVVAVVRASTRLVPNGRTTR